MSLKIDGTPAHVRITAVRPILAVTCVPAAAGITVSAARGGTTLTGVTDAAGYVEIPVDSFGTWGVSAEIGGESYSETVTVSSVSVFPVKVGTLRIYGAQWDGSSSTVLTRTDDSALFSDPVAAVGTGSGSSPFDSLYPWSEMEEYNVIDGEIAYKRGDTGFSRTAYDTVVYIPPFWYQRPDANTFRIANMEITGFTKHPGSGMYVARYMMGNGYVSKSGFEAYTGITDSSIRQNASAKGSKWTGMDFKTLSAIQWLYLVEYANMDSESAIGAGDSGTSGNTDSMNYHTGLASALVQYRHIESISGNRFTITDGVLFDNRVAYICTDPSKYANTIGDGYTSSGVTLAQDGFINQFGMSENFKWAILPTGTSSSSTGTINDYLWSASKLCKLSSMTGPRSTYGINCGIMSMNAHDAPEATGLHTSGRLVFDPSLT